MILKTGPWDITGIFWPARKDGSTFPVEVSLSTYVQNDERYVIAFIIDITKRKEIERNMILQQQQLEKITDQMRRAERRSGNKS